VEGGRKEMWGEKEQWWIVSEKKSEMINREVGSDEK